MRQPISSISTFESLYCRAKSNEKYLEQTPNVQKMLKSDKCYLCEEHEYALKDRRLAEDLQRKFIFHKSQKELMRRGRELDKQMNDEDNGKGDTKLIDKENIHPSKISEGVHVLVKVSSVKNKHYTYLGVAKSEVDEEGEVKIMFYKNVDDAGRQFKKVETDISYEPYDNILEIVPNPKIIEKGKRIYFDFDDPLNALEK
ncbi:hypothetical protein HHI36_000748 [Cryptolaemus montrouzieri]|uniref:Uncharacterized protein n=1 Tax=Cryptolaemus montrouzieri TaxID=559131 RepID=A0ABD2P5K3_9CUCU